MCIWANMLYKQTFFNAIQYLNQENKHLSNSSDKSWINSVTAAISNDENYENTLWIQKLGILWKFVPKDLRYAHKWKMENICENISGRYLSCKVNMMFIFRTLTIAGVGASKCLFDHFSSLQGQILIGYCCNRLKLFFDNDLFYCIST